MTAAARFYPHRLAKRLSEHGGVGGGGDLQAPSVGSPPLDFIVLSLCRRSLSGCRSFLSLSVMLIKVSKHGV